MNAPLVLLTGVVMFTGVLISWGIDDRPREFFAFLFILATGVFGVFVALDLFMLFFFYEIAVFPMYLLIAIWGWKVTREYAAMKLTLYLFIGSVVALVGALAMYFGSGTGHLRYDLARWSKRGLSRRLAFQTVFWFPFVFFGFAVLGGIFPFHNWIPDGHVAAPTAVSMFHAGVLMKLGAFAALRVGIMLLPEGAKFHMPWIILAGVVNVVYGASSPWCRRISNTSSVSRPSRTWVWWRWALPRSTKNGMIGAGVQMFSHGVMTALFFAVVGMVYDQAHTREIPQLGGFRKVMPLVALAFIIGGLVSMGMPGFSGFIAEFPIFMGVWEASPMHCHHRRHLDCHYRGLYHPHHRKVFFGAIPAEFEGHVHDVTVLDKMAAGPARVDPDRCGRLPVDHGAAGAVGSG